MSLSIPQSEILARLMDAAQLRHRVISQNLANVNTPGYRRLEVSFEDAFAKALSKHGEKGIAGVTPRVIEGPSEATRQDGNTVDLDRELGSLNKNSLFYSTAVQMLVNRIAMMRSAITGR